MGSADSTVPRERSGSLPAVRLSVLIFVVGYGLAGPALTPSLAGSSGLYPLGLACLIVLTTGAFAANFRHPERSAQQVYLALSIVPALTIARLALVGLPEWFLDPIFAYLLLAVAILVLRDTSGARVLFQSRTAKSPILALALGGGLAEGLSILGFVFLGPAPSAAKLDAWLWAGLLAPVALLDELWFRGLLQQSLTRALPNSWGWVATAAIFAAYGAPFGTLSTFVFRSAYGLVLGFVATRRENLPASLVARTAMTVALVVLLPGLAATSLIV